jgi:DNA-binding Xre family transcriptional regulator
MIEFLLADVLERHEWTPYRLAQETGLTVPTAYRLADRARRHDFGRFTTDTLDRLCRALHIQPGELFRWVPDEEPATVTTRSDASTKPRRTQRKRAG